MSKKMCDLVNCRGCAYEEKKESFFDVGFWGSCAVGLGLGAWLCFFIVRVAMMIYFFIAMIALRRKSNAMSMK